MSMYMCMHYIDMWVCSEQRLIDAAKLQEAIRLKQVAIKDTHVDIVS